MTEKLEEKNNTMPYIFKKNENNSKVTTGIENLFSENLFTDNFYKEKPKSDGGYHKTLDKNTFQAHMLANGTKEDFEKFRPLIEELKGQEDNH